MIDLSSFAALGSGGGVKRLIITVSLVLLAFAGVAVGFDWLFGILHAISNWLLALPEPTETWASIIRASAWPACLVYFLSCYRGHIIELLDTLAQRFKKDNVKLGPFEITANAEILDLRPDDQGGSTEIFTREDIRHVGSLLEFIAEPAKRHTLDGWVRENVGPQVSADSFLTEAVYATQRQQAFQALID